MQARNLIVTVLCALTGLSALAATEVLELSSGDNFITIGTGGGGASSALVNTNGGDLVWDVGETLTMELDIVVTDPAFLDNAMSWGVGVGDDAQSVGFGARYQDASTIYFSASVDDTASSGGNFSVNVQYGSDRDKLLQIVGTDADLADDGETAHMVFTACRNALNDYSMNVVWLNAAGTVYDTHSVVTTNAAVDSFTELLFKVNTLVPPGTDSYTITNITMQVDSTMTEYVEYDSGVSGDTWTSSGTQTRWMRPVGIDGSTAASNRVWNAGETVTMEFDVTVIASTNPVPYNISAMSLGFGLGDDVEAICWGMKHQDQAYQFGNISVDTSAGGAGQLSANLLSSSDRERLTGVEGTAWDLYHNNETAHMILSATYTGGTAYELSMTIAENRAAAASTNTSLTITLTRDEGFVIDAIDEFHVRRNLTSGTANFAFSNFVVKVESPTIAGTPDPWGDWLDLYPGLGTSTNYADDFEGDGMVNLMEFALGGNPTNSDAASVLPGYVMNAEGGTNYLNYVYMRSTDAETLNLISYSVVAGTDLVIGPITNATEEAGNSGDLGGGFESVTNRIPTVTETKQFMKLNVELN